MIIIQCNHYCNNQLISSHHIKKFITTVFEIIPIRNMSDEKVEIAAKFLQNAPVGEYEQCAAAIATITNDTELLQGAREKSAREWEHKQCTGVKSGENIVIICDEALLPDGSYVDPYTWKAFHYDFKSKMISPSDAEPPTTTKLRDAIQARLTLYAPIAYTSKSAYGAYLKDDQIVVVMRSSSVSLKNYRTGCAIGKYVIASDGTYTGRLETTEHFFENGNSMCFFGASTKGRMRAADPIKFADEFVDSVASFEEQYFESLSQGLEKIGEEGLSKLRRKLPVTATKVNWELELSTGGGMKK